MNFIHQAWFMRLW